MLGVWLMCELTCLGLEWDYFFGYNVELSDSVIPIGYLLQSVNIICITI
jgi:hypothetical protein